MRSRLSPFRLGAAISLIPVTGVAADQSAVSLTLSQAVAFALAHHPSMRSQRALEEGNEAGIEQARAAYLPDMEASQMIDRAAEAHNPPGLFLPMPGFPSPEGTQNTGSFGSSEWNSGTSIFVDENTLGLIRQISLVDAALAKREQAAARLAAQDMLVTYGAADAYMAEVSAVQTVQATQAGVERARVFRNRCSRTRRKWDATRCR